MTQLSGAPIWKDIVQFNNDVTLAHARTRAHTQTHTRTMLVPVTGLNNYKCKLARGYLITVPFQVDYWGGEGGGVNSYQAGQVTKVCLQFEMDEWANF